MERDGQTYLVGEMRWAVMFYAIFINGLGPALIGLTALIVSSVERWWPGIVISGLWTALGLGATVYLIRSISSDQEMETALIRGALSELLNH